MSDCCASANKSVRLDGAELGWVTTTYTHYDDINPRLLTYDNTPSSADAPFAARLCPSALYTYVLRFKPLLRLVSVHTPAPPRLLTGGLPVGPVVAIRRPYFALTHGVALGKQ